MAKETIKISSEKFNFIQQDEKIYDKKFETKPIGYFKDAMIRFGRNRTNVIATAILATLILLSIFVPMLTSKNYTELESQIGFLPPRIPLLENIGIADGTKLYKAQAVDRTTIDPETGIGLPIGFNPEYIVEGTLINYTSPCTDLVSGCYGGQVEIKLDADQTSTLFTSLPTNYFNFLDQSELQIIIDDILGPEDTQLIVYIQNMLGNYIPVQTITEKGVYNFKPLEEAGLSFFTSSLLRFELKSASGGSAVRFESITLHEGDVANPQRVDFGYDLFQYDIEGATGTKVRRNGEFLQSNFRYDVYGEVFALRTVDSFDPDELYALIDAYPDQSKMPARNAIVGFDFPDDFAVVEVNSKSDPFVFNDREYYTYNLVLNYSIYMGYPDVPHFLFGTSQAGHDLFALTWLGLRTSLLIGLVASSINIFVGVIYGAVSGYYGGKTDLIMERIAEIIGRIPWLVTLSIFITLIGPGALTLILILIISGWIGIAGVTRTQFYRYKGREYVLASRTLGANDSRLIFRHILPNGIGTIITASILSIPSVIFTEAALSYLGYGIGHGQSFRFLGLIELSGVSIGVLLSDGRVEMLDKPYLTVFPAIIISILMITFNMFGNALRDAFNPSLRGSE